MGELIAIMKDIKSLTLTCNDVNEVPKISANAKKVSNQPGLDRKSIKTQKGFRVRRPLLGGLIGLRLTELLASRNLHQN